MLDALFQSDAHAAQLHSKTREFKGKKKQGGVLSVVRTSLSQHVKSGKANISGLGR